ncbi:MAG: alanine--glyoxylate aminotransferase family protein [Geothrix sp.]|jgi:aspartate aminotransferase-like enzyme|uniref:Alanine--glyoxylate aminotransferase family protein n=1 Tax=Candidatus Geothrix odensensis TaxID=2954440 RepID=A0A936F2M5_9BACT|nr:alanine--glyoxylate aminotransferase family protein [Candidatus Geothrix odensensis]MBK8789481.1 alanine--glyoxylate aminotransferase family protein [Holophagaceae bacterium]MBP7619112.1 alanine--glyoxylate aminotransferase family protein [Geothrix sp.]MCC6512497.1 alanine--glyoxylate aminotransferase family protein [Geothrix sp.]
MTALLPNVDPDGLLEFSVVYTDRALNHMSKRFQNVMREMHRILTQVYHAEGAVIVPGSGTFGMEAVARQFATGKKALVIRDGFFSFRWSQIFDMGGIPASHTVLKARRTGTDRQSPWIPTPIAEVVAAIATERPNLVIAPHVETASGIILPDDYLKAVAQATHAVGGLFILDCVASGCMWVDMAAIGVDVIVTAPQKGWSGSPCAALVMLSEKAKGVMETTTSTSFACDLKKWSAIMDAYLKGGHAYHATMPTDALAKVCAVMQEMEAYGFEKLRTEQAELGAKARVLLESCGLPSVAAEGFKAPGVVVSYTTDPDIQTGKKFLAAGLQVAAGVPLQCDEPADFMTFRIGLFGLDKLHNVDRTVAHLGAALAEIGLHEAAPAR